MSKQQRKVNRTFVINTQYNVSKFLLIDIQFDVEQYYGDVELNKLQYYHHLQVDVK